MNAKPEVKIVYRTFDTKIGSKIAINSNSQRQTVQNLVLINHNRGLVPGVGVGVNTKNI